MFQFGLHAADRAHGVRFRRAVHEQGHAGMAVVHAFARVGAGADFDSRHVAEAHDAAVRIMAQDDVPELLGGHEAALHVQLVRHVAVALLRADAARGGLDVLRLHRVGNVRGGNAESGHAERVQPDAHGVFLQRHHFGGRHAVQTRDGVLHVHVDVVVQLHHVQRRFVRGEGVHGEDVVAALLDGDAELRHVGRQLRFGALDGVLQVHHGDIGVRAALECHSTRIGTGVAACRGEIQQVVHAVDLVFDRHGDGLRDHLAAGAGIHGRHVQGRRRNLGVFGNGEFGNADHARQDHDQADDDRETRPVNEYLGKHLMPPP